MTIKVLVVDDSPFICRLLASKLQSAADLKVIGTAHSGEEAIEKVHELKPDVVTLDQTMPNSGGLVALESIMHSQPTPIVMISGISSKAANLTRKALALGAVDFVLKYVAGNDTNPDILYREIIAKVRAASQIKVIRSLQLTQNGTNGSRPKPVKLNGVKKSAENPLANTTLNHKLIFTRGVVVIGASTGGPLALRELLSELPQDFSMPIVVVQHIPASFTDILADHLNKYVNLDVLEANDGTHMEAGKVYVAPGDHHLMFHKDGRIRLHNGPSVNGHKPAIDVTMQSAAHMFGSHARGIILTGMGEDGAVGMVSIRGKGGHTFAQNAESCVVNGMPQRAIDKGGVEHVGEPIQIAKHLLAAKVGRR